MLIMAPRITYSISIRTFTIHSPRNLYQVIDRSTLINKKNIIETHIQLRTLDEHKYDILCDKSRIIIRFIFIYDYIRVEKILINCVFVHRRESNMCIYVQGNQIIRHDKHCTFNERLKDLFFPSISIYSGKGKENGSIKNPNRLWSMHKYSNSIGTYGECSTNKNTYIYIYNKKGEKRTYQYREM